MRFNELCGVYKEAFDFCFEKASLLGDKAGMNLDSVLEKAKKSEIFIESSPFFIIIKFIRDVLSNHPISKSIYINVNHGEGTSELRIPTVFIMHFRDEKLVEIEFFNADSSAMDLDEIFVGKMHIECCESCETICEIELMS